MTWDRRKVPVTSPAGAVEHLEVAPGHLRSAGGSVSTRSSGFGSAARAISSACDHLLVAAGRAAADG